MTFELTIMAANSVAALAGVAPLAAARMSHPFTSPIIPLSKDQQDELIALAKLLPSVSPVQQYTHIFETMGFESHDSKVLGSLFIQVEEAQFSLAHYPNIQAVFTELNARGESISRIEHHKEQANPDDFNALIYKSSHVEEVLRETSLLQQDLNGHTSYGDVALSLKQEPEYLVNLVSNPSADSTPELANGWQLFAGNWGLRTSCEISDPSSFVALDQLSALTPTELRQEIDLTAYSAEISERRQQFTFRGTLAVLNYSGEQEGGTLGRMIVEYLDGNGEVLEYFDTGTWRERTTTGSINCHQDIYPFADTRVTPVGTQRVRIRLITDQGVDLRPQNAWYDSLSLVAEMPAAEPIPFPAIHGVDLLEKDGTATFEPYTDFGWQPSRGSWRKKVSCPIEGDGSFAAFSQQNALETVELERELNLTVYGDAIDARRQQFTFRGSLAVINFSGQYFGGTKGRIMVEYLDADGGVLSKFDTGTWQELTTTTSTSCHEDLHRFDDTRVAPPGTRSVKIRLISQQGVNERPQDAWYDSLEFLAEAPSLEPIPLPSPYGRNLVVDGGGADIEPFEEAGWQMLNGNWRKRTSCVIDAASSYAAISQNEALIPTELRQDISLVEYTDEIDENRQSFTFRGVLAVQNSSGELNGGTSGRMIFEYLDVNNNVLGNYDTDSFQELTTSTSTSCAVDRYDFDKTIMAPIGTRQARIRLITQQGVDLDPLNAWYDSLELIAEQPHTPSLTATQSPVPTTTMSSSTSVTVTEQPPSITGTISLSPSSSYDISQQSTASMTTSALNTVEATSQSISQSASVATMESPLSTISSTASILTSIDTTTQTVSSSPSFQEVDTRSSASVEDIVSNYWTSFMVGAGAAIAFGTSCFFFNKQRGRQTPQNRVVEEMEMQPQIGVRGRIQA